MVHVDMKKNHPHHPPRRLTTMIVAVVIVAVMLVLMSISTQPPVLAPFSFLEAAAAGGGTVEQVIRLNTTTTATSIETKETKKPSSLSSQKDTVTKSATPATLLSSDKPTTTTSTTNTATKNDKKEYDSSPASRNATNKVIYPLQGDGFLWMNLSSAQEAYERGFWQRSEPVPLARWSAVANTTCITSRNPHGGDLWKRRVPHVIMIGAQKAGTTALAYYLYNHPSIQYLPAKELHYFDEELDQNPALLVNGSGISAVTVLDYYQQTVIGGDNMVPLEKFQLEVKLHALDATPNYMLLSDRVPHRICCTAPWVKLLAVLRNPVDRAYSQYHMQFHRDLSNPDSRRGFVSFEEYIALDMKVLQDTGVLPQGYGGWNNDQQKVADDGNNAVLSVLDAAYFASDKVLNGWATYTKLGLNSPVGRGLYALQLQQWFQIMDLYHKPRSDLKVLSSHRLLNFPNETYAEIISFLELKPHSLAKYSKIHATQYRTPEMSPEIRSQLQAFYEPFTRLLPEVLSNKEWDGIWA